MLNKRFTFLCTEDKRDALIRLATFLHRSRGDTIRELIREASLKADREALHRIAPVVDGGSHETQR